MSTSIKNLPLATGSAAAVTSSAAPGTGSVSSGEARTQDAARSALTPVTHTPAPDALAEMQVSLIPGTLVVEEIQAPTLFDTPEQFGEALQAMIPASDLEEGVEEVFFDTYDLTQEMDHAQDIINVLGPFLEKTLDEKHGEGTWKTMFLNTLQAAQMSFAGVEDPNISEYSQELAWIAVSKLAAQAAGLPHEDCCPQFPWENTSEQGLADSSHACWQEIKPYLLNEAALASLENSEKTEQGSPSYLQSGFASVQNGLSYLATTMTANRVGQLLLVGGAIWLVTSIPGAAALPVLSDAALAALSISGNTTLGGCLHVVANTTADTTLGSIASGAATALGSTFTFVGNLTPYFTSVVLTSPQLVSSLFANGGPTCPAIPNLLGPPPLPTSPAIPNLLTPPPLPTSPVPPLMIAPPPPLPMSPVPLNLMRDGMANAAANLTNSSSLPMCPLNSASSPSVPLDTVAANSSWFGWLSYVPSMVYTFVKTKAALNEASQGNYGRAALNLGQGTLPFAVSRYWGPWAGIAASAALAGVEYLWSTNALGAAPVQTAAVRPAEEGFYERTNVVCKKGIFNIKVPGPAGLSPEQQEDLINAFIAEVLDQNPVKTVIGDKIEFQFPDSKKWTAHVTPENGQTEGRQLDGEKVYGDAPSDRTSIKKLETLCKVMVNGKKGFAVMTDLRSITMDRIPNNAPIVSPISFSNGHPALCSTIQAMLGVPEIRAAMEKSHHPELNRVANDHKAKRLRPGDGSDPVDLRALGEALNPKTPDAKGYGNALLDLMVAHGDNLNGLLVPQLDNVPALASVAAPRWRETQNTPKYPKLSITPSAAEESLQALVGASQSSGGKDKQFFTIPNFLQISVAQAQATDKAAKVNDQLELELDWKYIERKTRKAADPKPKYALQNFILHTAQGDVTYQKTVEMVNAKQREFFWKFDPASERGAPICIDKAEFLQAANSTAQKDLFFLNKKGGVEIVANRGYDSDSDPDLGEFNHVAFTYDSTPFIMSVAPYKYMAQAVNETRPGGLKIEVEIALQAALNAGLPECTLPVPLGDDDDGMNWPIGIMWYAAQEFIRNLPPGRNFEVKFAIDKQKKKGERREHLVQQIDEAHEIYLAHRHPTIPNNPAAFTRFEEVWTRF